MEYLEGMPLESMLIEDRPIRLNIAVDLIYQLTVVLKHLAEKGVVHRDVNPSNLMVTEGNHLRLLNLGLAKSLDAGSPNVTAAGSLVGTPTYISPEQLTDPGNVSAKSDLYAVGVLLFQMATGHLPFHSTSLAALFSQIVDSPPPDPRCLQRRLSEDVAKLINSLLAKPPKRRPTHESVLKTLSPMLDSDSASRRLDCTTELGKTPHVGDSLLVRIDDAKERLQADGRPDLLDYLPKDAGKPCFGNYFVTTRVGTTDTMGTYQVCHRLTTLSYIIRLLPLAMSEMVPDMLDGLLKLRTALMETSWSCPELSRLTDIAYAELPKSDFRKVYYTVEELQHGVPMTEMIQSDRRLQLDDALRFLLHAVRGVNALHEKGIVHGNLHPGKLFVDVENMRLAITDLSRSRRVSEASCETDKKAKLFITMRDDNWFKVPVLKRCQHIAPEILCEDQDLSALGEQYALGVIFIESTSRRFVPTQDTHLKLIKRVRAHLEDCTDEISREDSKFGSILRKMVATNEKSRFRNLAELESTLLSRLEPPDIGSQGGGTVPSARDEMGARAGQNQVFVSYSHFDHEWMERLQIHLKPYVRELGLAIWDDSKIVPGSKWRGEIKKALEAAKVAVLLVSPEFLASDFIAERELPPLLKAAKNDGVRILWVPIRHSSFNETEIGEYQAVQEPSVPLASLPVHQQDEVLVTVCKQIKIAAAR